MSSGLPPFVMSSGVETSLRLAACAFGRIHEISPRASLGRDDKGVRVTTKITSNHYPLKLPTMTKKETIKFVVQLIASIASAILTALGATSCMGM